MPKRMKKAETFPSPIWAMAEAGQVPAKTQPTPKRKAPIRRLEFHFSDFKTGAFPVRLGEANS